MKKIRRVIAAGLLTLGAFAAPALVGAVAPAGADDWGCVAVDDPNFGACVSNPLPERLPLP